MTSDARDPRDPRDPTDYRFRRAGFQPPAAGPAYPPQTGGGEAGPEPAAEPQAFSLPLGAAGSPYHPRPSSLPSGLPGASPGPSPSPPPAGAAPAATPIGFRPPQAAGSGGKKEIFCAFGVDVDAVAGWLGSYGGQDSPCDISRGLFSGEVGTPRLVRLFDRFGIRTSWFVPGHSIETFKQQIKMVVDAGHEIGMHGYSHENPISMTPEQEEAVMDRCIDLIESVAGRRPTGYVAPWWEFSNITNELLLKKGIKYDHSLMNNDFRPFYVRVGDSWTPIDYSRPASEWMKPLKRGRETDLIDIPGSWYLDDLPPMMFIKTAPNSYGFANPRDIEQLWIDQFDWVYREYDYAVFTMTIHPDVSGRPQVLLMLERIFEHISQHAGVKFTTFDEIADDFALRYPRQSNGRSSPEEPLTLG